MANFGRDPRSSDSLRGSVFNAKITHKISRSCDFRPSQLSELCNDYKWRKLTVKWSPYGMSSVGCHVSYNSPNLSGSTLH